MLLVIGAAIIVHVMVVYMLFENMRVLATSKGKDRLVYFTIAIALALLPSFCWVSIIFGLYKLPILLAVLFSVSIFFGMGGNITWTTRRRKKKLPM